MKLVYNWSDNLLATGFLDQNSLHVILLSTAPVSFILSMHFARQFCLL